MRRNPILLLLPTLLLSQLVMAVGPINFAAATLIKRLKRSVEQPIDLYKSTDGNHLNKLFTVRVIHRLEQGGLPAYAQTALRNEICASSRIQLSNNANPFSATPGAFSIRKFNENIVAIQDRGLMGERLDSVLRKLSAAGIAEKRIYAASYALEMVRILNAIHGANVTWNNASLSNLYVQPNGTLTAVDFSTAKNSPGGMETPDKQDERLNFLANTVRNMYEILFPATGEANADNAYAQFTALAGVGAAWRTPVWTTAVFNNVAAGAAAPTAYLPAMDGELATVLNITRAEHRPDQVVGGLIVTANMGADSGFALDADVLPLVTAVPGAPPWTNLTTMCAGW